jgi:acyl transferase domain-containing protein
MSAVDVERWITERGEDVVVAARNSPRMTVIAGGADAIRRVTERLTDEAVFCRVVRVDVASHSRHVDSILPALRADLATLAPARARIPIYSATRGQIVAGDELSAEYWLDNLRQPVLFTEAVTRLLADGCRRFIEVSPHPVLSEAIEDTCVTTGVHARIVGSVERDAPERLSVLSAVGALHADGLDVDWARVLPRARFVTMPPYPWQRKRYWISRPAPIPRHRQPSEAEPGGAGRPEPRAADCVFDLAWEASPLPVAAAQTHGRWLVLSEDDETASLLIDAARSRGIRVSRAEPGPAYEQLSSVGFRVRAGSADDLGRALSACDATHLVYVAPRIATTADQSWTAVEPALRAGVARLLGAVQAAVAGGVRFWALTRDGQSVDGEGVEPLSAALCGLLRVAWDEHPESAGGAIDIDTGFDAESARCAVEEIQARRSLQVAIRRGSRLVPRLRRVNASDRPATLDPDASYVVTGGLGGVGRILARRLVERGARHLVLVARQDLPPRHAWGALDRDSEMARRVRAVEALEELGAEVRVAGVDVADEDAVHGLIDTVRTSGHPLRGVVHAAATFEFTLLDRLGPEDVARAVRVKAGGAWHLHRAIGNAPLDFFIGCSSLASVIGLPGFASYAAANAFVDGLAHRRSAEGRAASSINWAGWRDIGRAEDPRARRVVDDLDEDGFRPFSESLGAEVFDLALRLGLPQLVAAPIDDASLRASRWPKAVPDLFEIWRDDPADPARSSAPASLRDAIQASSVEHRLPLLERELQRELGLVLHLPSDEVERQTPLGTLGLESLMAVEFRRRLEHLTGLRLPATVVWGHPTVEALAVHLLEGMSAKAPRTGRDPAATSEEGALSGLSESEALATLMKGGRG